MKLTLSILSILIQLVFSVTVYSQCNVSVNFPAVYLASSSSNAGGANIALCPSDSTSSGGAGSQTIYLSNYAHFFESGGGSSHFYLNSFSSVNGNTGSSTFYMNTGSLVNINGGGNNIFYVRNFATLNLLHGSNDIVYYEPCAIINDSLGSGTTLVPCTNISFSFVNPPPLNCTSASIWDSTLVPIAPTISITASANNICPNTPVTFTAVSAFGGPSPVYQWKKNNINVGINSTTYSDATLNNNDNIVCEITGTAVCLTNLTATSNTLQVNIGCAAPPQNTDTSCIVKPPNAFTPNGDGYNDVWVIFKPSCVQQLKVDVYNRWGSLVYHSDTYNSDWNGEYQNKRLADATYYYIVSPVYYDGRRPVIKGSVTILK